MPLRPLLALVILALALPAGCGGDDDGGAGEGSPERSTLTAAEYRKQGNALCARARRKVEEVPPPLSPDGLADYLQRVVDRSFALNDEFERLEPPPALRADHEEAVRLARPFKASFERLIDRVRESEDPAATVESELRKLAPEVERSERVSRRLGLDECIKVGPAPAPPQSS